MFVYHSLKTVVNAQGIGLIYVNPMGNRSYTNLTLTIHDFITKPVLHRDHSDSKSRCIDARSSE